MRIKTVAGFGGSLLWLGFITWLVDLSSVRGLAPNEIGDFLAGAFAPLAFFWLVLGYLQQGEELQQNTEALKMQADELRATNDTLRLQTEELQKNVKHQGELVEINQQEITAKHFSAKPYLRFKVSERLIIKPNLTFMFDENGQSIVDPDRYGAIKLAIYNTGETAKEFLLAGDGELITESFQVDSLDSKPLKIELEFEDGQIEFIKNIGQYYRIPFIVQFYDKFGKRFNQRISLNLILHESSDYYDITVIEDLVVF